MAIAGHQAYAECDTEEGAVATIVPVSEAKTRLTELLRRVEDGEEVVITRNGVEVAELRRRRAVDRMSVVGLFEGQVKGDVLGPVPELDGWELGDVSGA